MTHNSNLSVGLFVSLALAILITFTVWITGKTGNEPMRTYSVMVGKDVSGLMLGGPVYFLGVGVGEVTDLSIVPGDPPSIRVDIEVLESTPVNSGTRATLAAQGITGVSVINLANEPGPHPPLTVQPGQEHPLIPYRDSGFSAIMASAPEILAKVEVLLDRAGALLDEGNQAAIRSTLDNIAGLSASMASEEAGLEQLTADISATLVEVRVTVGQVQELLSGAGPGVTASITHIERAAGQLAEVTGRLDSWLAEHETEVQQFMDQGLGQVPDLVSDTRATMRELEKLLEILREDPSRVIYRPARDAVAVEE